MNTGATVVTADFLEATSPDNERVTLVVAHVWASTDMPMGALEAACLHTFEQSDKLMKNAVFSVRVTTGNIKPALTFYKPKHTTKMRMHVTGTKSWQDITLVSDMVGEVVTQHGFTFAIEQPEVDLVNLKFKIPNLQIRAVPPLVRCAAAEWFVPPEELQPGKPINISSDNTTILMWASGSVLVMLKRIKRGMSAQMQLEKSRDLLERVQIMCTTST